MLRAVFACVVLYSGVARADVWEGTYAREGAGGNELCPAVESVTVTRNTFTIEWTIRYKDERKFRVGKIDGTITAAGNVTVKATVFNPLAVQIQKVLKEMGDSVDDLAKVAANMEMRIQSTPTRRMSLASGACYASWDAGPAVAKPAPPTPKTTSPQKPKPPSR